MNKTNLRLLENTRRWRKTKRGLVTNIYHKMLVCKDCKYRQDNLVFKDFCNKVVERYDENGQLKNTTINSREYNENNNCIYYADSFIKKLDLFINRVFLQI